MAGIGFELRRILRRESLTHLLAAHAWAGLIASGSTTIDRAESAAISYPSFFAELERLRA